MADIEENTSTDIFITEVQKYPWLYDVTRKDFRDVKKKENSWKLIAVSLKMPVDECSRRWKNLRDRYSKELRRGKGKSGDSGGVKSPWPYLPIMSFLKPYVKPRRTMSNVDFLDANKEVGTDDDFSTSIIEDISEAECTPASQPANSHSARSVLFLNAQMSDQGNSQVPLARETEDVAVPTTSQHGHKRFRKDDHLQVETEIVNLMRSSAQKMEEMANPCLHFGMHVAKRLNELSSLKRSKAEAQIMMLLFEIESENV